MDWPGVQCMQGTEDQSELFQCGQKGQQSYQDLAGLRGQNTAGRQAGDCRECIEPGICKTI